MNALQRRTRPLNPRHKARHTSVPARGFTMMEMVIVLGIVMVVTAMAIPMVKSSLGNFQLRGAVSSVAGVIQSTRYLAISQGYPFQVSFDKTAGTYQVLWDQGFSGAFINYPNLTSVAVPFSNASTTLGANATLQFSGGGSVKTASGTMPLVLTGSGRTGTITVSNYGNVNITYAP